MEPSFKAGSPPLRLRRIMSRQTRNTRRAEGPLQQAMAARAAHHEPRNKGFHRPFRLHEHDPRSTIHCLSTRNTNHGFFSNHGLFSSHRLDSLPGIAHHCPALPGSPAANQVPGALWQPGHRLHGCSASPRKRPFPGNKSPLRQIPPGSHGRTATRGFGSRITRHESRNTAFPTAFHPSRLGATAIPATSGFGSRNTKHETRPLSRPFPAVVG